MCWYPMSAWHRRSLESDDLQHSISGSCHAVAVVACDSKPYSKPTLFRLLLCIIVQVVCRSRRS